MHQTVAIGDHESQKAPVIANQARRDPEQSASLIAARSDREDFNLVKKRERNATVGGNPTLFV